MVKYHTLVDPLRRAFAADEGARRRRQTLMVWTAVTAAVRPEHKTKYQLKGLHH